MSLRAVASADHAAVAAVVEAAFGEPDEARLVEAIRAEGAGLVELVAEEGGAVVGHILFSRLAAEPDRFVAGLAPVSVTPSLQGRGVGGDLCNAGIEACRALGVEAIVVLGHPTYYPRFGFSAELARNVASPYAGRPAWMAMELKPGALSAPIRVRHPAAFG